MYKNRIETENKKIANNQKTSISQQKNIKSITIEVVVFLEIISLIFKCYIVFFERTLFFF